MKVDQFFRETSNGRYIPRAILTDFNPDDIDAIQAAGTLPYEDIITAKIPRSDYGSNAVNRLGGYDDMRGQALTERIEDCVKNQVEKCD